MGEMAHQLYVYQTLVFSVLGDMVNTRGNANPQVSGRVSTCARTSLYVATHSQVLYWLASLTIIGELARMRMLHANASVEVCLLCSCCSWFVGTPLNLIIK